MVMHEVFFMLFDFKIYGLNRQNFSTYGLLRGGYDNNQAHRNIEKDLNLPQSLVGELLN
eukprot:403366617